MTKLASLKRWISMSCCRSPIGGRELKALPAKRDRWERMKGGSSSSSSWESFFKLLNRSSTLNREFALPKGKKGGRAHLIGWCVLKLFTRLKRGWGNSFRDRISNSICCGFPIFESWGKFGGSKQFSRFRVTLANYLQTRQCLSSSHPDFRKYLGRARVAKLHGSIWGYERWHLRWQFALLFCEPWTFASVPAVGKACKFLQQT